MINKFSKEKNAKVFACLEGGYSNKLGELIEEFILGFT